MGEMKELVASTPYVWALVAGAVLEVAWFGLPLWALLYFFTGCSDMAEGILT